VFWLSNNRVVGHVGGDVDPILMDATAVLAMSKWAVAELVHLFHTGSTEEEASAVEKIVARLFPIVWVLEDGVRILDPKLSMPAKTLLVLYHSHGWVAEDALLRSVEHSNPSTF
jgi:hypothetical protein